jgi:GT2 family glycosyltransferase
LLAAFPDVELVQFLDGDCELVDGWLAQALDVIEGDARLAVVFGRRRERTRDASIYTRLYDIEWEIAGAEGESCGGDALMRLPAFVTALGFNEAMQAGEEPELCLRLRAAGWRIRRLAVEMSVHDSGTTGFRQWWVRMRRTGYGYANGVALHHGRGERLWMRQSVSAWFWAAAVPLAALVAAVVDARGAAIIALAYPFLVGRIYWTTRGQGLSVADSLLYAAACTLAKLPQVIGQLRFWSRRRLAPPVVGSEFSRDRPARVAE